jgi:hypothetical protein
VPAISPYIHRGSYGSNFVPCYPYGKWPILWAATADAYPTGSS